MLRKLLLILTVALPMLAQKPWNGNLTVLGYFNMGSGTYSAPFVPVASDPTVGASCSFAFAVVVSPSGQQSICLSGGWIRLGVVGPASSTNFGIPYWNGTSGGTLGSSTATVDASGNLVGTTLATNGSSAGMIQLIQGPLPSSFAANSIALYAPTSIATAYQWRFPTADAAGLLYSDGAATPGHLSLAALANCLDTAGQHVNVNTSTNPPTFFCGTSGGSAGSAAFGTLTSGTNSQAAMVVSTGASLTFSASGTINANRINGSTAAASATTDTTSASNISSGTLGAARLPAFTGDTTVPSGSSVTTTVKVNGTSVPVNSAADQALLTSASAVSVWSSVPSCVDSGGNHLNYNTATHLFSCGTSGGTAGSAAFGTISSGTNTSAAMIVGNGATLAPTGTGTIDANLISGSSPAASATTDTTVASNISSGTLPAARLPAFTGDTTTSAGSSATITASVNGTTVPVNSAADQALLTSASATGLWSTIPVCLDSGGNHLNYNTATHLFSCGTSGGSAVSAAFNTITSGTNASAAMICGAGCSLAPASSGTIDANLISGSTPAASATTNALNASNISSGTLPAARFPALTGDTTTSAGAVATTTSKVNGTTIPVNSAADQAIVTTALATGAWASIPLCLDTSGQHINYNTSTHAFSCGTSAGSAISPFSTISSGTNNAAAMVVGTGASLAPIASGTITANLFSGTLTAANLPNPSSTTLGGIRSFAAVSHQWINAISTSGIPSATQPAASDITGLATSATTDTTSASNISSGTLGAGRLPAFTGDTTTSAGSAVTTTSKVNGTTVPVNSVSNQVLLTTAAATGTWTGVPVCLDSAGQHLNFDTTTHAFSCGTTSSAGPGALPTINAASTGKALNNNGASASWAAPSLDCSQFAGADMSLKIQACLVALNSLNSQGGIADARNFQGTQTWSVNPFAAASKPRSGKLLLPFVDIDEWFPLVTPGYWTIEGSGDRSFTGQTGTTIRADPTHFHAWASPDAGTITTATANSTSGVTITGSGTAFAADMVGCNLVAGPTLTSGTGTTVAGIITAVTNSTSLKISYNIPNAAFSGHTDPYAIYCSVIVAGAGEPNAGTSAFQFGMSIRNLRVDGNSKAGSNGITNWFSEEYSEISHVSIGGYMGIGLDRESSYSQNSGSYHDMTIGPSSSAPCTALNYVSRINGGSGRSLYNFGQSGPCTGGANLTTGFDLESPNEIVSSGHVEAIVTAFDVGDSSLNCPVACPQAHISPHGSILTNVNGGVSGTTLVKLGAFADSYTVSGIYRAASFATLLNDTVNSCTITADNALSIYSLDRAGGIQASGSPVCPPKPPTVLFANLPPSAPNGSTLYCSDCKNVTDNAVAFDSTAAGSGNGTQVNRQNGAWRVH